MKLNRVSNYILYRYVSKMSFISDESLGYDNLIHGVIHNARFESDNWIPLTCWSNLTFLRNSYGLKIFYYDNFKTS